MRAKRVVAFLFSAVLLSGCGSSGSQSPIDAARGARHRASSSPIQHVVIIMQENRSFDNMFYGYPGANTATSGKGHDGTVYQLQPINLAWEPRSEPLPLSVPRGLRQGQERRLRSTGLGTGS